MIVQTERTILREANHDDAMFILQLLNEPGWLRFIGDQNVHSLNAARQYIDDRFLARYAKHGFGNYVVCDKPTHTPLGIAGFVKRETLDAPDIGYAMRGNQQRKGYAFEAAHALIKYGRNQLGFTKLYGYCLPDNVASVRMLEKLGLTYLRDQDVNQTGELVRLYSTEWPNPV